MPDAIDEAVQRLLEQYRQGKLSQAEFQYQLRELSSTASAPKTDAPETPSTFSHPSQHINGQQINVAGNFFAGDFHAEKSQQHSLDPDTALGRYLQHVIESNRRLQLQGIRSAGELVNIELEKIYITLSTITEKSAVAEAQWPTQKDGLSPSATPQVDPVTRQQRQKDLGQTRIKVQQALADHERLVVLGDPGSGKTTLLCYLALTYARDLAGDRGLVSKRLALAEQRLPLLLPLRDFASHLQQSHPDPSLDGPKVLLDYLRKFFVNQDIALPERFFGDRLQGRQCAVLLDGVDEVADAAMRNRIARIIERFTNTYPDNRYVVTSRIVGYTDSARLGSDYAVTKVSDFSRADRELFVTHWNHAIETALSGHDSPDSRLRARRQTQALLEAIENNERVRELAVNPLLLTVIALVQRYRARLPERRSELYEEAIEVLLGKWDEAKGLQASSDLLDAGDRRSMLEPIALKMMEARQRTIDASDLKDHLKQQFGKNIDDELGAERAADAFLRRINERSGLLTERGRGIYSFSHLTFQEHLAARAVADRQDYIPYTVARMADSWWREVVLLETGYLSTQGQRRVTDLIQAMMNHQQEPEPYCNLVLAADCLRDVGQARVTGDLWQQVLRRLRTAFDQPLQKSTFFGRVWQAIGAQPTIAHVIRRRAAAAEALARMESGTPGTQPAYWRQPYREPLWAQVPAGEFLMGDAEEQHALFLETYWIAKVPVTNAQYQLFVEVTAHRAPGNWIDSRPPRGQESHPVTEVDWHDAMAYCAWLSQKTGKTITLPSEAQWEKAARGADGCQYPWGDEWDAGRCNNAELRIGQTTPVGIFPDGVSPYGCLDMAGNVFSRPSSGSYGYLNSDSLQSFPHNERVHSHTLPAMSRHP